MKKPQIDRKTALLGASVLALLFLALCLFPRNVGRYTAAILTCLGACAATYWFKKRQMPSKHRRTVLIIVSIFAAFYMTALLLTGFRFGFFLSDVPIGFSSFFQYILPLGITIISTEIIRGALLGQKGKLSWVFAYAIGLLSEVLMQTTFTHATSFNRFMDLAGMILLPAVAGQFLYQYVCSRYGILPSTVYRLIIMLFPYILPIQSGIPESLTSMLALLAPSLLLFFLHILYAKKAKTAKSRKGKKWLYAGVAGALLFMISFVMLVSCQFRYGMLIIATESMTGELNKGDVALYEQYDEQAISKQDVIVFERDGRIVIHRVIDITHIDGKTRYFTKGDANDDEDYGYITDESIVGVVKAKLPGLGYPTLSLRELFAR